MVNALTRLTNSKRNQIYVRSTFKFEIIKMIITQVGCEIFGRILEMDNLIFTNIIRIVGDD